MSTFFLWTSFQCQLSALTTRKCRFNIVRLTSIFSKTNVNINTVASVLKKTDVNVSSLTSIFFKTNVNVWWVNIDFFYKTDVNVYIAWLTSVLYWKPMLNLHLKILEREPYFPHALFSSLSKVHVHDSTSAFVAPVTARHRDTSPPYLGILLQPYFSRLCQPLLQPCFYFIHTLVKHKHLLCMSN